MTRSLMCLASAAVAVILGCETQRPALRGTPLSPNSVGYVRAAGTGDQTQLTVTVYNLPKPQLVANDATRYIAWAKPSNQSGQPQMLGQVSVDDGEVGTLEVTTALRDFELIITAEPPESSRMSGEPVLTGHVGRG